MGQWKKHDRLKKRRKVSVRKEKSCLSMWILSEITKHMTGKKSVKMTHLNFQKTCNMIPHERQF